MKDKEYDLALMQAKGLIVYDAMLWRPTHCFKMLGYDRDTKTITVDKAMLMDLIQFINPAQELREIKLVVVNADGSTRDV